MSDDKDDTPGLPSTAIHVLKGDSRALPTRLGISRVMGAAIGALLAATLYYIPGMPLLPTVFIFVVFGLLGREVGAWLAMKKFESDPYSVSDWDHIRIVTSRLVEMGVPLERAKREASRIVAITNDLEDLQSVRYLHAQIPADAFAQGPASTFSKPDLTPLGFKNLLP